MRSRLLILLVVGVCASPAAGQERPPPFRPMRDRPVDALPTGTASLVGRVAAAETGRPLKRARVTVAPIDGRPRSVLTDEAGRFAVKDLPAGKYAVSAVKTGFVRTAFGQRRALRDGTPIEVRDGQTVSSVDMILPRGGVITGRLRDEDGEPLSRAGVRALRFQYQRGERRLMPAGNDQTDDRGEYRIFALPPGEYVVTATVGQMERNFRAFTGPIRRPRPRIH
jgi:hypothetical protein